MKPISAEDVQKVPFELYIIPPEGGDVDGAIELNYHAIEINDGSTATLVATKYPATASVTWTVEDSNVATVSGGVVTAVGAGNTIVTAAITVNGVTFTDTCTVVVE